MWITENWHIIVIVILILAVIAFMIPMAIYISKYNSMKDKCAPYEANLDDVTKFLSNKKMYLDAVAGKAACDKSKVDLEQCSKDKGTCVAQQDQIRKDLETCKVASATCEREKATAISNVTNSSSAIATCTKEKEKLIADKKVVETQLAQCNTDKQTCSTNLTACNADKQTCASNLTACNTKATTCDASLKDCQTKTVVAPIAPIAPIAPVVAPTVAPVIPNFLSVGLDKNVYYRKDVINDTWKQASNSCCVTDAIQLKDGTYLGVGYDYMLYTKSGIDNNWVLVPNSGAVTRVIQMNDGKILGIGNDYKLYTKATVTSPWVFVGENTCCVYGIAQLQNGTFVGVGHGNDLWTKATLTAPWVNVPNSGSVKDIKIDSQNRIIGIGMDNYMYYRNTVTDTWKQIPNSCCVNKPTYKDLTTVINGRYVKLVRPTIGCMNLGEIIIGSPTAVGVNLAKTATITKSSAYGNDMYPNKNLIDDNDATFVHTSCNDAPWIQFDLGKIVPISNIVLKNRKDCCQGRTTGIVLTILDEAQKVVYTSDAIKDQSGSITPSEVNTGGPFMVYTWTLPNKTPVGSQPLPYTVPTPAPTYAPIKSSINTSFCADVEGGSQNSGAKLLLWGCHGGDNQQFIYKADTTELKVKHSGKCVDIPGGGSANGLQLQQYDCNNSGAQKWQKIINADGTYTFKNPQSNKCFDLNGGSATAGNKIHLWDCNGGGAQKWK